MHLVLFLMHGEQIGVTPYRAHLTLARELRLAPQPDKLTGHFRGDQGLTSHFFLRCLHSWQACFRPEPRKRLTWVEDMKSTPVW